MTRNDSAKSDQPAEQPEMTADTEQLSSSEAAKMHSVAGRGAKGEQGTDPSDASVDENVSVGGNSVSKSSSLGLDMKLHD
ncbi:hypothetical protein [Deinococcus sp.]|uniref:hypothetical protein n=1 Tax=Deinococcus sp. TaxID=47478 RepID=UPI0025D85631|nr:hypothetical protein [Deinococcus sp.]